MPRAAGKARGGPDEENRGGDARVYVLLCELALGQHLPVFPATRVEDTPHRAHEEESSRGFARAQ